MAHHGAGSARGGSVTLLTGGNSLREELRTLFWLQWKLTLAMFRSRQAADRAWVVQLLLRLFQIVFTLPVFLLMGAGVALVMILFLTPEAAVEFTMVLNTFMLLFWLLLPASYNSQIMERFEMSRLFHYPVSFRGIVIGSTLVSLLSMTGLWTLPLLLGEIVGLIWHAPLAFPFILLGAVPTFALLVLSGRIMEDFFDLVAGDRRLRAAVLFLLSLPFILIWAGQYLIQLAPEILGDRISFLMPLFERLEQAQSFSEALTILNLSRFLIWLPTGWTAAAMSLGVTDAWTRALFFLIISLIFVGAMLWAHGRITRRLMEGAALTIGPERVRTREGLRFPLPGPDAFWALFRKDWLYLRRSPLPRRFIFSVVIMIVAMSGSLLGIPRSEVGRGVLENLPIFIGVGVVLLIAMTVNTGLLGNYFGAVDREGFGMLALSGVNGRYVMISSVLATSIVAVGLYMLALVGVGLLTGRWMLLPLGLYLGICVQLGSAPVYLLSSIMWPYRTQLKFSRQSRGNLGNFVGFIAALVAMVPAVLLIVLPYVLWRPALILSLP
ncbi:MAG: hypothetical protein ACP5GX_11390, partial [Anaerolineae bacterium]